MVSPPAQPAEAFAFERIRYEKAAWRATVTINRPEVLNCLDFQTLRELSRAFEDASSDAAVRPPAAAPAPRRGGGAGGGSVAAGGATQWLPLMVGDRRARQMLWLCE